MLGKLSEKDFAVLRGPLESGRQSPQSLSGTLFLGLFIQALIVFLIYNTTESTVYPNVDQIKTIHYWTTGALMVLSILYAFPFVYKRGQKIQYLLGILVSQNAGAASMFLGAIFFIGESDAARVNSLINLTFMSLAIALVLFIVTYIRFYILLKKGKYREGSDRDILRQRFEARSYLPIAIVGSTGLVLILQYLIRNGVIDSIESILLSVLPLLIFYTMIFVLPEQLVILYCKFRFKSFNFNERGYLYSTKDSLPKENSIGRIDSV
ncbi:ABC transporter ATPase [Bacillus sp. T33-2]|uniref:ABC transporter ATPase n=1 Tax=Bacillus sp. T33-2 TaxID=2054168 RepID=UPI000C77CE69|nr:ABC transporter ATPase [Bacillus sp. T33-2]PLR95917.1 ABC transporter ATPase [Bacillus sp. T33-2]